MDAGITADELLQRIVSRSMIEPPAISMSITEIQEGDFVSKIKQLDNNLETQSVGLERIVTGYDALRDDLNALAERYGLSQEVVIVLAEQVERLEKQAESFAEATATMMQARSMWHKDSPASRTKLFYASIDKSIGLARKTMNATAGLALFFRSHIAEADEDDRRVVSSDIDEFFEQVAGV